MGYQKYVAETYRKLKSKIKNQKNTELRELVLERKKSWRKSPTVVRVERPVRIDKARKHGYKAKQGFVVARCRVRRGGARISRPTSGRKPGSMGVNKITRGKSIQRIAEERANKRFPNLEVLGSYWLWEDGQYKWFEVVLVDPSHPVIRSDKDIGWIARPAQAKRVLRGLTPAGKKGRGLRRKGKGAEKVRPSIRAKGRKAK
ncbi:MAG: 50S ribosomal protein L15e [Candidatus Altiarchaeota archaeon]